MRKRVKSRFVRDAAFGAVIVLLAAACADGADDAGGDAVAEAGADDAAAESDGDRPLIIAFTGDRSERYQAGLGVGLEEEAANAGYDIRVLEHGFEQSTMDELVQQELATGAEPDLWVWYPAEGDAALASLRDVAATGVPMIQINQLPSEAAEEFIQAYAGPDDALRARNAGEILVDALEQTGADSGNVVAVSYPSSYGGYGLSIDAFNEAIEGSGLELIGESTEGFGSQNGFTGMQNIISQVGAENIDFVYGMDDAILQGAIQALEEAGLTVGVPGGEGVDVIAAGTVCNGDRQLFEEGRQYGTTLQSPQAEGQLAIQVASELLESGSVAEYFNFTPNPPVLYDELDDFELELPDGEMYAMDDLCTWSS
jgi:ribose transport system substrate-binding protein